MGWNTGGRSSRRFIELHPDFLGLNFRLLADYFSQSGASAADPSRFAIFGCLTIGRAADGEICVLDTMNQQAFTEFDHFRFGHVGDLLPRRHVSFSVDAVQTEPVASTIVASAYLVAVVGDSGNNKTVVVSFDPVGCFRSWLDRRHDCPLIGFWPTEDRSTFHGHQVPGEPLTNLVDGTDGDLLDGVALLCGLRGGSKLENSEFRGLILMMLN